MKKRVVIVHGWDGEPGIGWFPWLKMELEKRGFAVSVPALPHPDKPTIEDWVGSLGQAVGVPDAQTYFVGHSMGCQTIIRYLASLPKGSSVGGAVFVAGFFLMPKNMSAEENEITRPWIENPLDTEKVKNILTKSFAIFSPTDRWVHIENKKLFEERLGSQTFVEDGKGEVGHFAHGDGVMELPKALELILELSATPTVSIDDFFKLEIKMGKILSAEKISGADKLLKLSIDLGNGETRTIASGIAQFYQPEEVVGRTVPVITNLAPRMLRGVESKGMVLMADDPEKGPTLLVPIQDVPPGSVVK